MRRVSFLEKMCFPVETELRRACEELVSLKKKRKIQTLHLSSTQKNLFFSALIENQMLTLFFDHADSSFFKELEKNEVIRQRYFSILYTIQVQMKEFSRVIKKLKQDSVPFVVQKATPYLFAENKSFHKELSDLDILVSVSDFRKAALSLSALGYNKAIDHEGTLAEGSAVFGTYYSPQQEEIFYKKPFTVEIHTTIVNSTGLTGRFFTHTDAQALTQDLANDIHAVQFLGHAVSVLSSTRLFISLFVHTCYHHYFQSAVQFYEVAKILRTSRVPIDWNYCFALCRKYKMTRQFYWFLCLLHWLFPHILPQKIQRFVVRQLRVFTPAQRIVFFLMKYRIFYPKTRGTPDFFRKITSKIIDGTLMISIVRRWMPMY